MRQLRLRMSDETVRSVMVDENQPVANLMVIVCTKLGITNHDEYSLIATGKHTLNGRRRINNDGRIIDQKMEQLKKKLKTDEDLAWVDHSKTLDEQDIHEQDVVLLRRRFFYSDHNVDSRDPIQLGLLYVQTRDAILSGTHPVTVDGACRFAGIQCQAQLGDFVESKTTRPGYLNLKDCLPADYAKVKHIERKIFVEHKRYLGLSELEAKAKYVGEARSLPTYGVTFFLVKEKLPGKNKLVPRLLGITKDCVMRVDADTKGILKTWPLTTVKRWAASMNSFTLDFGDYSDSYYSVQTNEGEQISQLIAGYIDIILRRRKAKDHFGIEGDEGATMIEDSVAPSRATIIQNQPALGRPPSAAPPSDSLLDLTSVAGPTVQKLLREEGPKVEPPEYRPAMEVRGRAEIGYESRPATQYVTNYELTLPQRDLHDKLEEAHDAVEEAQRELDRHPPASEQLAVNRLEAREVEQKRRKLSNQFAEINAATAELVSLSAIPEEELNYTAINSAVDTVRTQLPVVAKDVRIVAQLMEDDESGERLIDAARRLCKAFSDLLVAAEPGPTVPRQTLISAASRVGDATQALLYTISNADEVDEEESQRSADELLSLAKSVASSAAALVLKAKDVASTCRDEELQNLIIGSATQCALATSQMVATAKIVAPTIYDPSCQRKLIEACREVQRAAQGIQSACQRAIRDDNLLCEVNDSVDRVQRTLDELIEHVRIAKRTNYLSNSRQRINNNSNSNQTTTTTTSTTTTHRIYDETSGRQVEPPQPPAQDPAKSELVAQARHLARATAALIQDIRPENSSEETNTTRSRKVMIEREEARQRDEEQRYQEQQQRIYREQQQRIEREQQQQQQRKEREQQVLRDEQEQREQRTTTTITTTVYDHHHNDQRAPRPTSYYDSEEQQVQRQDYYTETSSLQRQTDTNNQQQQMPAGEPAEAAISGIVGDLETTIMFATAGNLRAHDDHDSYLYHRENVLRCAKALVEDTRPLVASAASNEQQLAQAAQESVFTMSRLADTVKASAASLGPANSDSQVCLIRSVKDVAVSLADLIGSTKSALGCDSSDPRLFQVKDSAKTMVTSVTSLLKSVKSVEDEQQRGLRAIESCLEALEQELVNYGVHASSEEQPNSPGTGGNRSAITREELVRTTRPVTMATAKTVHAASSGVQDDAIVASNMGRKALIDLLQASRSASFSLTNSYELRSRLHEATRQTALNYKHLMELLHRIFQHPSIASANPEVKQELIGQSKAIAGCISELVSCSELLKQQPTTIDPTTSGTSTTNDWLQDQSDELLGAASSIDAVGKKLENLKPRVTSVKIHHEEQQLNFDEIILDASKSIPKATAALLRAASASQRELIDGGRLDETETFYAPDNNQWSEGLVSAAREVADSMHRLREEAELLVQGQASEERLISIAKQVASSTNQLLVACKVKADPDSRTMTRLAEAANQVKRATDNLVRAAQRAIEHVEEQQSLIINSRKVPGIAQEISAREEILMKEKELQVAKTKLMAIRKAKYGNRPDDYQGYGGSID